jgi:hypothetical protein
MEQALQESNTEANIRIYNSEKRPKQRLKEYEQMGIQDHTRIQKSIFDHSLILSYMNQPSHKLYQMYFLQHQMG